MKSLTAVCQTGASMPAIKTTASAAAASTLNGRIQRHPRHRNADGENAEMKMYLSKLKDLVPFMPKRKLSKLEIIQHVIDYICDLQTELETHPEIGNFDAATALSFANAHAAIDDDEEDDEEAASAAAANDERNEQADDEQHDMLTPSERLAIEAMQQQQQHLQYMQHHQRQHHQQQQQQQQQSSPATSMRQPLVDRQTPNTILPSAAANTITTTATATPLMSLQMQMQPQHQHQQQTTTTPSMPKDSRQSAC